MTNTFDPSIWVPQTPEHELYGIYEQTIKSRFGFFGTRPYEEAAGDFTLPLLPYDDGDSVDQDLLELIVTPESFANFIDSLDEYTSRFGLKSWLEYEGSLAFVTNHRQFTDVPVVAEAIGRLGLTSRSQTLQVVSKMITGMTLDLGQGEFVVMDKLRNISSVTQTVPRIDGPHSKGVDELRDASNEVGTQVIESALDTPGTVVVESIIGRHDVYSRSGKTLFLHEPNIRTAEILHNPKVKIIPLFFNCVTFRPDGTVVPAELGFEFHEPIHITKPADESTLIMNFFRDATRRALGSKGPRVRIIPWRVQRLQQMRDTAMNTIKGSGVAVNTDY